MMRRIQEMVAIAGTMLKQSWWKAFPSISCDDLQEVLGIYRYNFEDHTQTMIMRIVIIAGPNGAGKTTFARDFLPQEAHCPDFINADLIAAGLSPFRPEVMALRAGRLMLEEISESGAA